MKIPFSEFSNVISAYLPDCRMQDIPTAPYVHVFDERFLQEEFWPAWSGIVKEINRKLPSRPLQNSAARGLCDEVTKRLLAEACLSSRQTYGDEDVGPGMREVSVLIPDGYSLNMVPGYGWHRTVIVAVTKNGTDWRPLFIEPQLEYANYQTTTLDDAASAGVTARECWV
jgi:hypothetical protein